MLPVTSIHKIEADGVRLFYRAAGDPGAPVVLLLHGFPTSSFMFRELIPRLASDFRVIAPDMPGFGFTEVPAERNYVYSFDRLAATLVRLSTACLAGGLPLGPRRQHRYLLHQAAPARMPPSSGSTSPASRCTCSVW